MKRLRREDAEVSQRFLKRVENKFPRGEKPAERHLFWRLASVYEHQRAGLEGRARASQFVRWSRRLRKCEHVSFVSFKRCSRDKKLERVIDVFGGKDDFPPLWRGDDIGREVKERIAAMTGGTCAWCEILVIGGQHGDVEHVRPKSRFPMRAYDWGNYLLSCEICNGKKWDRWPKHGRFVRPDYDTPGRHFDFSESGVVYARNREAQRTINALDLNREALVIARRTMIDQVLRPLRVARECGLNAACVDALVSAALPTAAVAFSGTLTACLDRLHEQP